MDKFVGFFRTVSYLFFLAALLWSYAYLVGQVDYGLGLDGNAPIIDRNTYFFSAILIFLFVNIIISWFLKSLKKVSSTKDGIGLRNYSLKKDLLVWFKGFGGIINLVLALIMFFIGLMNISESRSAFTLNFYVYLGPILLLVWLIYLVVILTKTRTAEN
jgi:surface polysaccharide O-acyltransferase-like enzyme